MKLIDNETKLDNRVVKYSDFASTPLAPVDKSLPKPDLDKAKNGPDNYEMKNYMFIQNLEQMAAHALALLELDKEELDQVLADHAWAVDHVATSKDDLEEVHNFLIHGNNGDKE